METKNEERAALSAFIAWGESVGLSPALQTVGELKAFKAEAEWQAAAAWQRAQGAVPEGWREFVKGDTYEVGDCGNFESGINHLTVDGNVLTPEGVGTNPNKPPKMWGHRIVVYGNTAQQAEALRDRLLSALSHTSLTLLAAAPTVKAGQVQCEFHGDDSSACEKYSGNVPCEPAPANPAERQEQGEVQRLREALEEIRHANMNGPVSESNAGCIKRIEQIAERALAASTGQEVEK